LDNWIIESLNLIRAFAGILLLMWLIYWRRWIYQSWYENRRLCWKSKRLNYQTRIASFDHLCWKSKRL